MSLSTVNKYTAIESVLVRATAELKRIYRNGEIDGLHRGMENPGKNANQTQSIFYGNA